MAAWLASVNRCGLSRDLRALGRWFEVYAFPIGAPAEHKVALLFKDISDRKAIETQRERLRLHPGANRSRSRRTRPTA